MKTSDSNRFYLHKVVKEQGYKINVYQKVLYVPYTQEEYSKHALRLRDVYNYVIQSQLV